MLKLLHDPISVPHSTARLSCAVCHSQLWILKNIGWIQGKNICCDAFMHTLMGCTSCCSHYTITTVHVPGWAAFKCIEREKGAQRSRRTTLKETSCFVGDLIDPLLLNTCKQQLQIFASAAAAAQRFPSPITMRADWIFNGPPFILNHQHGQFAESMNIKLHKSFF